MQLDSSVIDMFSVLIVQNNRSLQKIYSELLGDFGLKISDVACLMIIRHNVCGCSATAMRDATCYDKALISRMLAEMQEKGLVCRNPDDEDRQRGMRFILTEKGLDITHRIDRLSMLISQEIEKDIAKDELERFCLTGSKLTDNLRRLSEDPEKLKGGIQCLN